MQPTRHTFEDRIEEMVREYCQLTKDYPDLLTRNNRVAMEGALETLIREFSEIKLRMIMRSYGRREE